MNFRENTQAILHYKPYDSMPLVSFGYWRETLEKWAEEGHITKEQSDGYANHGDNSKADQEIMKKLGFDFNWNSCPGASVDLFPRFEVEVLESYPDGSRKIINGEGLIVKDKPGTVTIPAEIGTSLTNREAWEKKYLPNMQFCNERINKEYFKNAFKNNDNNIPIGVHCGSLIGTMRNFLGVEELSYLYADDYDLFVEIAHTFADLSYKCLKEILSLNLPFSYAHYWEDICFKNGPLISPNAFEEIFADGYKRNSELLNQNGIDIISVDCDGFIDKLVPIWLANGVNTMFPIEVGTWQASIKPWREQYGKTIRGVGGMNKTVFAYDYKAIDNEIERLRPLIELGGYIPCPDHRIAPDAKFENVQYYCEQFRKLID